MGRVTSPGKSDLVGREAIPYGGHELCRGVESDEERVVDRSANQDTVEWRDDDQ